MSSGRLVSAVFLALLLGGLAQETFAVVTKVSGDGQSGSINRALPAPLVVNVDCSSVVGVPNPLPCGNVLWASTDTSDVFSPNPSPTTGSSFVSTQSSTSVTLGSTAGTRTITATALALPAGQNSVTFSITAGALGSTPTLSPAAQSVGQALDTSCAGATGAFGARCDQIAQLPAADRAVALQQIAPEEIVTQGTVGVEAPTVQNTNIGLRLASLRSGVRGLSVSGLALNQKDRGVPAAGLANMKKEQATSEAGFSNVSSFSNSKNASERGGAAGADEPSLLGGRLGLFVNGQGSFGDKDATSREAGFEFDTKGVTAGADYRFTDQFILGAALGYISTDSDLDLSAGDSETRGYSLSIFGTYYLSDKFYIDAIATYGWNDYDSTRNIVFPGFSGSAKGDTDGTQLGLSASGGYNVSRGGLTFGPYARVEYIYVKIDSFTETGADELNLSIDSQRVRSLTTALGGQMFYAISTGWGVLSPNARLEWEHQYKDRSRRLTGTFAVDPLQTVFAVPTDDPDKDYFNLGLGVAAQFQRGRSAFIHYETVLDREDVTNHSFIGGIRVEF